MIFIKLVFSESVLGGILGRALEGMKKNLVNDSPTFKI